MKQSKSILLVEDSRMDQLLFIYALKEIENAILHDIANNGKEALDKLENADILPDLIFMDVQMPVMDGIECLEEIIKNPQLNNIPVVILSSCRTKAEVVQKLGAKAFLEKPFDSKI